jgi:hypothetical protein
VRAPRSDQPDLKFNMEIPTMRIDLVRSTRQNRYHLVGDRKVVNCRLRKLGSQRHASPSIQPSSNAGIVDTCGLMLTREGAYQGVVAGRGSSSWRGNLQTFHRYSSKTVSTDLTLCPVAAFVSSR